jgi:hypothetical protein
MAQNDHIQKGEPAASTTAAEVITRGGALQQVRTDYFTAVRVEVPRDMAVVKEKVLHEARLAGESCLYGWQIRGKTPKRIEGLGIQAAMILSRNYGNCIVDVAHVVDRVDSWEIKAVFIDLETGVSIARPFRKAKKTPNSAKMDRERAADFEFQNGVSKAERNVALHAMPVWLRDDMLAAAKEGAMEKLDKAIGKDGIETVRQKLIDALAKFGVDLQRIEDTIAIKRENWGRRELFELRKNAQTLKDGLAGIDMIFPGAPVDDEPPPKGKTQSLKDKVKSEANGGEAPPEATAGASSVEPHSMAGRRQAAAKAEEAPPAATAEPEQPQAAQQTKLDTTPPPAEDKPIAAALPDGQDKLQRLGECMAMDKTALGVLALESIQAAMDCGAIEDQFADYSTTGGISPFMQEMIDTKVLASADIIASSNNKGHLARFIVTVEGLIAGKQTDEGNGDKADGAPY